MTHRIGVPYIGRDAVCVECGRVYPLLDGKPDTKEAGVCDVCGGAVEPATAANGGMEPGELSERERSAAAYAANPKAKPSCGHKGHPPFEHDCVITETVRRIHGEEPVRALDDRLAPPDPLDLVHRAIVDNNSAETQVAAVVAVLERHGRPVA